MLELEHVVQLLCQTKRVVALTGAGISEESGVPTFRGKGGIWESYSPAREVPKFPIDIYAPPC